ncbi:MAG: hypothetical protein JWO78_901 [Micavibrio sp.]|nr:hypothetical protein [Micavibrio sp.]
MKTDFLKNAFSHASDYIPDALERGYHRGIQALNMTQLSSRLAAGQDLASPSLQKLVRNIASREQKISERAAPEHIETQIRTILESRNIGKVVVNGIKNPRAVFNTVAEGMAAELPTLAVAAGCLLSGPAAPVLMTVGLTAASASSSYGQEMMNQFRKHGYDLRQAESVNAALSNRFMMEAANEKAVLRATISAGFTLATLGASRIVSGVSGAAVRAAENFGDTLLVKTAIRTVGQTVQSLAMKQRLPTAGEYIVSQTAGAMNGRVKAFVALPR